MFPKSEYGGKQSIKSNLELKKEKRRASCVFFFKLQYIINEGYQLGIQTTEYNNALATYIMRGHTLTENEQDNKKSEPMPYFSSGLGCHVT